MTYPPAPPGPGRYPLPPRGYVPESGYPPPPPGYYPPPSGYFPPPGYPAAALPTGTHTSWFTRGYLFPLWDAKRQTIADKIMSTVCLPID